MFRFNPVFPHSHAAVRLPSYALLQFKAFGDLVIAAASLRSLPAMELSRCRLVIGPYLKDLAQTLAPGCEVEVLNTADITVPAAFDVKRLGIVKGIASLLTLRAAVARAAPDATLVMERLGIRERFIVGRHLHREIPCADNVYLGYEAFIAQTFAPLNSPAQPLSLAVVRQRRVLICPISRVGFKNLPPHLVIELARVCEEAGLEVEILLLEGELFEYPNAPRKRVIPCRFSALSASLSECAAVISADSLPAHLAEYCGTPTFVVSPIENCYWFPKRVFQGDHWGLFSDKAHNPRLRRFLSTL